MSVISPTDHPSAPHTNHQPYRLTISPTDQPSALQTNHQPHRPTIRPTDQPLAAFVAGVNKLWHRYVSSSKQETCLCKACENFTCYEKTLKGVLETVQRQLLHGCEDEEEIPEAERDPVLADPDFKSLVKLEQTQRRIDKVSQPSLYHCQESLHDSNCSASAALLELLRLHWWLLQARGLLCPGAFNEGRMGCVDPGGCEADCKCCKDSCGFKGLWSKGLREKLIDSDGELKPGVNPVWL